jgi:hypothetical protein
LTLHLQSSETAALEARLSDPALLQLRELRSPFVTAGTASSFYQGTCVQFRKRMHFAYRSVCNTQFDADVPGIICHGHTTDRGRDTASVIDDSYNHLSCKEAMNHVSVSRHNQVRDATRILLRRVGLTSDAEIEVESAARANVRRAASPAGRVPADARNTGATFADITVDVGGVHHVLDITVFSRQARSLAAVHDQAVASKRRRYEGALQGRQDLLVPLVFTGLGCPTAPTEKWFKSIFRLVPPDQGHIVTEFKRKISQIFQWAVGSTVQRTTVP